MYQEKAKPVMHIFIIICPRDNHKDDYIMYYVYEMYNLLLINEYVTYLYMELFI